MACGQRKPEGTRETRLGEGRRTQPETREGKAGLRWESDIVARKRVTSVERRSLSSKATLTSGKRAEAKWPVFQEESKANVHRPWPCDSDTADRPLRPGRLPSTSERIAWERALPPFRKFISGFALTAAQEMLRHADIVSRMAWVGWSACNRRRIGQRQRTGAISEDTFRPSGCAPPIPPSNLCTAQRCICRVTVHLQRSACAASPRMPGMRFVVL